MAKIQPDAVIKVMLSVDQINLIFSALEQKPYAQVFQTIDAMRDQVIPQINTAKGDSNDNQKG